MKTPQWIKKIGGHAGELYVAAELSKCGNVAYLKFLLHFITQKLQICKKTKTKKKENTIRRFRQRAFTLGLETWYARQYPKLARFCDVS